MPQKNTKESKFLYPGVPQPAGSAKDTTAKAKKEKTKKTRRKPTEKDLDIQDDSEDFQNFLDVLRVFREDRDKLRREYEVKHQTGKKWLPHPDSVLKALSVRKWDLAPGEKHWSEKMEDYMRREYERSYGPNFEKDPEAGERWQKLKIYLEHLRGPYRRSQLRKYKKDKKGGR